MRYCSEARIEPSIKERVFGQLFHSLPPVPAVPAGLVFLAGVAAVVVVAQDLVEDAEAPQDEKRSQRMMAIIAHTATPWVLLMTQAPTPKSAVQAYTMTTLLAHAIAFAQKHMMQVLGGRPAEWAGGGTGAG